MGGYLGVALTNPVEGKEQAFNEWYDNQHVPDLLAVPGCVAAQRYKLADHQRAGRPPAARAKTPAMPLTDAVAAGSVTLFFMPLGPRIEGSDGRRPSHATLSPALSTRMSMSAVRCAAMRRLSVVCALLAPCEMKISDV